VRELVGIPLYLTTLLLGAAGNTPPNTKEEVIRLFIEQHENAAEHATALREILRGRHRPILLSLATHFTGTGVSTVSEADARRVVTTALANLRQQGQVATPPEPSRVLEVLTSHHTLMRGGGADRPVSFQHQQFQEWFASHEVVALMRASSIGDADARQRLRTQILDRPAWDESVLFAVERESRDQQGDKPVAHAVRLALPIDPMLAAEMIHRSSPRVWELVKGEINAFVTRWHRPGTVDRAVRFMIITGRPEFASYVLPLATSEDSQVLLRTLRAAPRFRPAVLGPDLAQKIAALPPKTRQDLLASIALQSDLDGMDFATASASSDPDPNVQVDVVRALSFRGADRHVSRILDEAHDQTWRLLARRGYDHSNSPVVVDRLRVERQVMLAAASDPIERLRLLVASPEAHSERDNALANAVADASFPIEGDEARSSFYFATERARAAVLRGIRLRLERGLALPPAAYELLGELEVTDEGPIAAAILNRETCGFGTEKLAVLAGPRTVGALVDRYLACAEKLKADRNNQSVNDEYHRLRSRIAATRATLFVPAVLSRTDSDDPRIISALASLVSAHGKKDSPSTPLLVLPELKPTVIGTLRRWVEVVISSAEGTRYHLREVGNAIGKFAFRELLPELRRLAEEDLARLASARANFADAWRRGDLYATSDAGMRYGNQYANAFSRLGGRETAAVVGSYLEDRVFGVDAAVALRAISDSERGVAEQGLFRKWPWLNEIMPARARRATQPKAKTRDGFSGPIFAAIERLTQDETDKQGQVLALELAPIALGMPHSNEDEVITRLLSLAQPVKAKQRLLAAVALEGHVLDATMVMQAIDDWLTNDPHRAWEKRQNTWEIEPWLELLPFTNHPEAVLEGLRKVKAFYGSGWPKRWERVLTAVAQIPGAEGENLLAALARSHKDIADEYDWVKTILGRSSVSAVLLYFDLVKEGVFGSEKDGASTWHASHEVAEAVRHFPELKPAIKRLYEDSGSGRVCGLIEDVFGEIGDDGDVIVMIRKHAASRQLYTGGLDKAVRAATLRNIPDSEGSNTYYVHPAPVGQLRKMLFDMLRGTPEEAALATRCLIATDVLRDEYGISGDDPRHPDVVSGIPWPPEAPTA
jgi:hypothetical protein